MNRTRNPTDTTLLTAGEIARALAIRDLTDPASGPHAMQIVLDRIVAALTNEWRCDAIVERAHPAVAIADNYDRLRYDADAVVRDRRYTRYVAPGVVLRTHTTAMIPPLLRRLAEMGAPDDVLLVCPGRVYRRDSIDRLHTGEPHQVDLWRIRHGSLTEGDLERMVALVAGAALPDRRHRMTPVVHPYTVNGRQIDMLDGEDDRIEVGECGIALPGVLEDAGLPSSEWSGLAMGLGLDRLLMLAKGIDDIRLLSSDDQRIAAQMLDLAPWRPVSRQPPVRRDLSVALGADVTEEEVGDRVRRAVGDDAAALESVEIIAETVYADLPPAAIERIGIAPHQKNALIRVVIRHPARALTSEEANALRDRVYAAVHEGSAWQWAGGAV